MIVEYGAYGKRPTANNLLGNVQLSWFNTLSDITFQASLLDLGWCLLRMCPKEIFDVLIDATENQAVPGWTLFNMTTTTVDLETTKIGYCPLLPASPTDFSTVFTTLKNLQKMMKSLGQQTTVVTFDEAIYSKAKEVQWRSPDEFKDVVIRLGGMHMAQCFLATIGKCFEASGMEDIFIESGVFASSSIPRICNGKAYNRGLRAHKLLYECMYRLLWQAFSTYVKEKDMLDAPLLNIELAENSLKQCRQGFVDKDVESIVENQSNLLDCMPPLNGEVQKFVQMSCQDSKTFAF